jgi:hypothetical protein
MITKKIKNKKSRIEGIGNQEIKKLMIQGIKKPRNQWIKNEESRIKNQDSRINIQESRIKNQ